MIRQVNSEIEIVENLTEDECKQLFHYDDISVLKYEQYVCEFKTEDEIKKVEDKLRLMSKHRKMLRCTYQYRSMNQSLRIVMHTRSLEIPIKDISMEKVEKQAEYIKNYIVAEGRRVYNCEKDYILNIRAFRLEEQRYLAVMSLCQHPFLDMEPKKLLSLLFGVEEHFSKASNPSQTHMEISGMDGNRPDSECEKTSCPLLLPDELRKEMDDMAHEYQFDIRTFFLIAWGLLLCKYFQVDRVLQTFCTDTEKMSLLPVCIERKATLFHMLEEIDQQLRDAKRYDSCSLEELEKSFKTDSLSYFSIHHNFIQMNEVDKLLTGEETGTKIQRMLLRFHSSRSDTAKLTVNYQLFARELLIYYDYDTRYLKQDSIDGLHETLSKVLLAILTALREKKEKEEQSAYDFAFMKKENLLSYGEVIRQQKIQYLKETGCFDKLDNSEMQELSVRARLKSVAREDILCREKTSFDKLYVIGEGNIEVSMMDAEGYEKSVHILGSGDIFGMECLLPETRGQCTYSVLSAVAKVVEVPKHCIEEILEHRPAIYQGFLAYKMKEAEIFKKLWVLS